MLVFRAYALECYSCAGCVDPFSASTPGATIEICPTGTLYCGVRLYYKK